MEGLALPGRNIGAAGGAVPWLLASLVSAAAVWQPPSFASGDNIELRVEAAYLLHFARYVYWPSISAPAPPLILGVFGTDPMGAILEKTVSGKTVNSRAILVRQFNTVEQIDHCDILFVPRSAPRHVEEILRGVAGKPIVTVSDKEGFSRQGGMIEFLLIDDTVRFDINTGATEHCGLKLSSELLRVAYSINGRRK